MFRANARLYDAAAGLSDADYRADRGVFFRSMHGTLNHLLATDRIWMQRFTGSGTAPEEFVQPLSPALDHWFNHHAHHRGQAHALLTGLGRAAPELDLLFYQRLVEAGKA